VLAQQNVSRVGSAPRSMWSVDPVIVSAVNAAALEGRPFPCSDEVGAVDVWSHLTRAQADLASEGALLDESERARAARFRFDRDCRRYVERHAFARRVLARYLGCDPADVAFRTGSSGKPELDGCDDRSFNLSQDDDLTVLVVGDGRPVGVDVERVRAIDNVDELAEGLFAPDEVDAVRAAAPAARSLAFLTLWTRKEAVAKAMGVGLAMPLDEFTVLSPTTAAVGRPRSAGRELPFAFAPLAGLHGYVGTAACAGERIAVRAMDERDLG
jgi:4'-phosphopantetheinyl transferase